MLEADAAAGTERHAFLVEDLRPLTLDALLSQRDDHVPWWTVGGADRQGVGVAEGLLGDLAGRGQVLIQE